MAKKVALVLSGGGSKGAFQYGAERYLREEKGYQWDLIAGVSVGALNGAMLAMHKYERLRSLWENITRDQVMTGRLNLWALIKIAFGAQSIYGNQPLRRLLESEIEPTLIDIPLMVGAVSLKTGEYTMFTPQSPGFKQAVLASTAIPVVWAPVVVSTADGVQEMVDGGVRNISPLGDILDYDPDEVVFINCSPRAPTGHPAPFKNAADIGLYALDLMMNEIFVTDLREFLRINYNVMEAAAVGVTLHNQSGEPYKFFEYTIIEPDEDLGDSLDFSREVLDERIDLGWEKAKWVMSNR